jgi:protein-S-isoprenylcysteine O-methyltransferase Ste14
MVVYLLVYLLVVFVWPSWRTWKVTGVNPVTFGRTGTAHDYVGRVMRVILLLLFAEIGMYVFNLEEWLMPVHYLIHGHVRLAGLVLLHVSLVWMVIAQYQMGTSWRIGIDSIHRTDLKTSGLFSVSRNPVFLGMLCSMSGIFLVYPDMLSGLIVAVGYVVIHVQIRLEEAFLLQQHGNNYLEYCRKVRRLL